MEKFSPNRARAAQSITKSFVFEQPLPAPPVDPAMVEWLNKTFPERAPDPADNDREIWMKAGERRLINRLCDQLAREQTIGTPGYVYGTKA